MTDKPPSIPMWYVRAETAEGSSLDAYMGEPFADGDVIDASTLAEAAIQSARPTWRATADRDGRLLTVLPSFGPPMWFVQDDQTEADPPTISLIAFATHHFPAGMIVTNDEFEGMPVDSDQQIGAVKWWTSTGQINEVYVQPERRREKIGHALMQAAAASQVAAGRHRIWGGGDRTDLGEAFVRSQPIQQRVAPRTSNQPPMTPEDRQADVPHRNLHPDS